MKSHAAIARRIVHLRWISLLFPRLDANLINRDGFALVRAEGLRIPTFVDYVADAKDRISECASESPA